MSVAARNRLPDHYETLGIAPTATAAQVRTAYRALAKLHHPDVSSRKDASQLFARIAAAYEVLSSPKSRREYDAAQAGTARQADSPSETGKAHFTWSNIAAAGSKEAERDNRAAEIDELYDVFFGKRSGNQSTDNPPSRGVRPGRGGKAKG